MAGVTSAILHGVVSPDRERKRARKRERARRGDREGERERGAERERERFTQTETKREHDRERTFIDSNTDSMYRGYSKVRTRTAPRVVLCS